MYSGERIVFIDTARTYALILALLSHAIPTFGVPDVGGWIMNYPIFTTMATPLFIFMFGVMMEIVYVKRAKKEGVASAGRRMFKRAYQCYLSSALVSLAALLGGYISLTVFFSSLVFIENSRYTDILFTYAGALLMMPIILRFRLKHGHLALMPLFLAVVLLTHVISFSKNIDLGFFGVFINQLIGAGDVTNNPSVLGAFIFILLGMIAGQFVLQGDKVYLFSAVAGGACLIASLLVWGITENGSVKELMTEYAYGRLRSAGSILYFLMGSFYCLATLSLIKFVVERFPKLHGIAAFLSPLGKHSLLAFALGNILLNLWGPTGRILLAPSLAIPVFFIIVYIFCRYQQKIPTYGFWQRLFNAQNPVGNLK
tara:strand:+ start:2530 stop:3639 length:1110 start_codon:yes stop_codon:yes gene_type:complete